MVVSSLAIPDLLRQAEAVSKASRQSVETRFTRPELDSDFAAPRNAVEQTLCELWGKLLGVDGVGINDSFFDLGGHSLIAVRLFNEVSDRYGIDLPMSVLMQSPTVAALGTLIQEQIGDAADTVRTAKARSKPRTKLPRPCLPVRRADAHRRSGRR